MALYDHTKQLFADALIGMMGQISLEKVRVDALREEGDYRMLAIHQDVSRRDDWEKVVSGDVDCGHLMM